MSSESTMFKVFLNSQSLPKGSYAEVGVFLGSTFKLICEAATRRNLMAHAFDSFFGMDNPTSPDFNDKGYCHYPKGKFNIGGPESFVVAMTEKGIDKKQYKVWAGLIPFCFEHFPEKEKFCFARIDLDHFLPTYIAASWAFNRLLPGGVMFFHDYFKDATRAASKAIKEFCNAVSPFIEVLGHDENELFIKKLECATTKKEALSIQVPEKGRITPYSATSDAYNKDNSI